MTWPRLSADLTGPREPGRCQSCGCGPEGNLKRWREHDDRDRPERIVVVLCVSCSGVLVEPHPRLYAPLPNADPWPGCMGICLACTHRFETACAHPDEAPGGPGVQLAIEPPVTAHVCYAGKGRRGGQVRVYPSKATGCSGREVPAP